MFDYLSLFKGGCEGEMLNGLTLDYLLKNDKVYA